MEKTKVALGHGGEGGVHPKPSRNFDIMLIFDSSSIQHIRWRSL